MSSDKIIAIKLNREFRRMYYRGKSAVCPAAAVYYLKNRLGVNRLGITAGKKVGGAVERNRAKRVIRAAYRSLLPELNQSGCFDIVIVARSKTPCLKSDEVARQLKSTLCRLNLLRQQP